MKIGLVCTQGGHLTQTLELLDAFRGYDFFIVTHDSPRNEDVTSAGRAYFLPYIGAHPDRLLLSFLWAWRIIRAEKPDVLLSMGAEIGLSFLTLGKLLGKRTIYIESWSRVENLSLTGRLVFPFVDVFWVQWPQLAKRCGGKAQYRGAVL